MKQNTIKEGLFYRWLPIEQASMATIQTLQKELETTSPRLGEIFSTLLLQLGLDNREAASAYYRPQYSQLHDPMKMKNMEEAVSLLLDAMAQSRHIRLYGDYDVDGTTAIATLLRCLKPHYDKIDYYISDRFKEGYGLSEQGILKAAEDGVDLLITLDCGIKATERITLAKEKGMQVIICDHHEPPEELPPADAILDIKQAGETYPYQSLSGCGVGYKLMQALYNHQQWDENPLHEVLDLLAISVASDLVPVTGENRILLALGLQRINNNPSPGVAALLGTDQNKGSNGQRKPVDYRQVVFGIGPRINAAGRLKHASHAVETLIASDPEKAQKKAGFLNELNTERKRLDREIQKEALSMADEQAEQYPYTTVVYAEHWFKGVIGIVASRLQESHFKPTIVLTQTDKERDIWSGSARSVPNFNLLEVLHECSAYFLRYGGHAFAAGLTMAGENLQDFRVEFEQKVRKQLGDLDLMESLPIHYVLDFKKTPLQANEMTALAKFVRGLGPFGPENHQPVFLTEDLEVLEVRHYTGRGEGHLKLFLSQEGLPFGMPAIAFGRGELHKKIKQGDRIDLCYYIELNFYQGQETLQFRIKDLALKG